jgi:streptogramin lyase
VIPPAGASAAPTLGTAAAGAPRALRTERVLDRATLAAWGVARPTRLAFDGEGALYILDASRRRVVKVDPSGRFLHEVTLSGEEVAPRAEPADVVVDARGSVLILDRATASVLAYDKGGARVATHRFAEDLREEAEDPRAVLLLDAFGRLWLIAPRERDLVRLDASLGRDRSGRFLTPEDSVAVPAAATTLPNGETWIADAPAGRVRRFRASGALTRAVAAPDSTSRVVALAADRSGYVFAGDVLGQRILVYNPDGALVLDRALGGATSPWRPFAVAWSPLGALAAADPERGEVQMFSVERAPAPSGEPPTDRGSP